MSDPQDQRVRFASCPVCGAIVAACAMRVWDNESADEYDALEKDGFVVKTTDFTDNQRLAIGGCKCADAVDEQRRLAKAALR